MKRFAILPLIVSVSTLAQADQFSCMAVNDPLTEADAVRTKAVSSCKLLGISRDDVKQILRKTLIPNVHVLQRKIYLYHYGRNPTGSHAPVRYNDRKLAERYFYDPASKRDFFKPNQGYSLYMAADPLVSVDYSQEPGLLLRIAVPAGVKYLDSHLELSADDAHRIWCYLNSTPSAHSGHEVECNTSLSLSRLIDSSPEAAALLREVMKPMGIEMLRDSFRRSIFKDCEGENPELKMIDPALAPKLEMTLYSPYLEKNPSSEKRAAYEEVFQYFNVVRAEEVSDIKNGVEPAFWTYYQNWASALRNLPPHADLRAYQREQSDQLKDQRIDLLKKDFGCGIDGSNEGELLHEK